MCTWHPLTVLCSFLECHLQVVREVQEFFADYLAIGPHLITFNLPGCVGGDQGDPRKWDKDAFERIHPGLLALLLSLKKKPVVRYQESSPQCKKLAEELCSSMSREASLFDFRVNTVWSPPPASICPRIVRPY